MIKLDYVITIDPIDIKTVNSFLTNEERVALAEKLSNGG